MFKPLSLLFFLSFSFYANQSYYRICLFHQVSTVANKTAENQKKTAESKIKTTEQNGTKWKETKQRFMPTVFPSV